MTAISNMPRSTNPLCCILICTILIGCRHKYRDDLDYSYNVEQTWSFDDLAFDDITQFETVAWQPDDTALRANREYIEFLAAEHSDPAWK